MDNKKLFQIKFIIFLICYFQISNYWTFDSFALDTETDQRLSVLMSKSLTAYNNKDYEPAVIYSRKAYELGRRFLNETDETYEAIVRLFAFSLDASGNAEQAIVYYEELLAVRKKADRLNYKNTVNIMNLLINQYTKKYEFDMAKKLSDEALTLSYRILGPENEETIDTLFTYARLQHDTGNLKKALDSYKNVYEWRLAHFGKNDESTLAVLTNLADIYGKTGEFNQSEAIIKEALEYYTKTYGKEHLSTINTMMMYATLLSREGRYEEAEKMETEALERSLKVIGKEHPYSLYLNNELAIIYISLKKYDEAIQLCAETLPVQKRILGLEHPYTLKTIQTLTNAYIEKGDYAKALPHAMTAMRIAEKVYGEDQLETCVAMDNLSLIYACSSKFENALELRRKIIDSLTLHQGYEYFFTINQIFRLGILLYQMNRFDAALQQLEKAVKLGRKVLGENHPDTIKYVNNFNFINKRINEYQMIRKLSNK